MACGRGRSPAHPGYKDGRGGARKPRGVSCGTGLREGKVRGGEGPEQHPDLPRACGPSELKPASGSGRAEAPEAGRCCGRPLQTPPSRPRPATSLHPRPLVAFLGLPREPGGTLASFVNKKRSAGNGGGRGRSSRNTPDSARRALHGGCGIFPEPRRLPSPHCREAVGA